jgi:hypothetical protein
MNRVLVVLALGGCYVSTQPPVEAPPPAEGAPAEEPPPGDDPAFWQSGACLRLTVKNLEVAASDYDGPAPEERSSLFCSILGAGAAVAAGVVSAGAAAPHAYSSIKSVCEGIGDAASGGPRQRQRRAEAPDIAVGIKVGDRVLHRSPTLWDSYAGDFGHAILIPAAAVPQDGIKLVVLDDDPPSYQELGSFRLGRDRLTQMRNAGLQRLADFGPNVGSLEIVVDDYEAPPASRTRFDVRGKRALAEIAVPAGAILQVSARGSYTVREGEKIGPLGSPGSGANLKPLEKQRHGAAYAAVGDGTESRFVPVPDCRRIVSAPPGYVVYGINDSGFDKDNRGTIDFAVEMRLPTPREWLTPFRVERCR